MYEGMVPPPGASQPGKSLYTLNLVLSKLFNPAIGSVKIKAFPIASGKHYHIKVPADKGESKK